jgi:hypothetical protein
LAKYCRRNSSSSGRRRENGHEERTGRVQNKYDRFGNLTPAAKQPEIGCNRRAKPTPLNI